MVGLPARGKTYIAKKLSRYLNWVGIFTKGNIQFQYYMLCVNKFHVKLNVTLTFLFFFIFYMLCCIVYNLGEYRRSVTSAYKSHEFFRPENQEAMAIRTECAIRALEDACKWLQEKGEVAVFDATNSTSERRKMIHDIVVNKWGYKLFFVESICDDPMIIEQNIMVSLIYLLLIFYNKLTYMLYVYVKQLYCENVEKMPILQTFIQTFIYFLVLINIQKMCTTKHLFIICVYNISFCFVFVVII